MSNLYLIEQDVNNHYDTYDSAVVVSYSPEEAVQYHPAGDQFFKEGEWYYLDNPERASYLGTWAKPEEVRATLIGAAADNLSDGEVIIASFNAG